MSSRTRTAPAPAPAPPAPNCATLERADDICRDRGVRLTHGRRRVLEILCAASRPIGAYEILAAMREGSRAVAPPTVYRALEFLVEQGLVHKLESLHAFVGCDCPGHTQACQFLICVECGGVVELNHSGLAKSLEIVAQECGFAPRRPVVELIGTCAGCSAKGG
jgi:Fur family transcriptional regulator, zinc uptake regulator